MEEALPLRSIKSFFYKNLILTLSVMTMLLMFEV